MAAKKVESFEALYADLEAKARKLEQGNLPLDDSIRLYEEGAAIVDRLKEILSTAELRIETVRRRMDDRDTLELREDREPWDEDEDAED